MSENIETQDTVDLTGVTILEIKAPNIVINPYIGLLDFTHIYEDAINVFLGRKTEHVEVMGSDGKPSKAFYRGLPYPDVNSVYNFVDYAVYEVCVTKKDEAEEITEEQRGLILASLKTLVLNYTELINRIDKTVSLIIENNTKKIAYPAMEEMLESFTKPFYEAYSKLLEDKEVVNHLAKEAIGLAKPEDKKKKPKKDVEAKEA